MVYTKNKDINENISNRIRIGWIKWRDISDRIRVLWTKWRVVSGCLWSTNAMATWGKKKWREKSREQIKTTCKKDIVGIRMHRWICRQGMSILKRGIQIAPRTKWQRPMETVFTCVENNLRRLKKWRGAWFYVEDTGYIRGEP